MSETGRDAVLEGTVWDGGRVPDRLLAAAYADGYKAGLADARRLHSSVVCICCGGVIGPSAPHNETRCWECRKGCGSIHELFCPYPSRSF